MLGFSRFIRKHNSKKKSLGEVRLCGHEDCCRTKTTVCIFAILTKKREEGRPTYAQLCGYTAVRSKVPRST